MRTYDFTIHVPDELGATLDTTAMKHGLSSRQFCAEIVEATVASYRLPGVQAGKYGPYDRVEEPRSPIQNKSAECLK
jgi:hypothetical protein